MALFLASYDIPDKNREEYQELWDYFDSLKAVKIQLSEYAVPFPGKAIELADKIIPHLKADDRLIVCELFNASGTCAWKNLMVDDTIFQKLLTSFARTFK
jgi:hypothetical protein